MIIIQKWNLGIIFVIAIAHVKIKVLYLYSAFLNPEICQRRITQYIGQGSSVSGTTVNPLQFVRSQLILRRYYTNKYLLVPKPHHAISSTSINPLV